MKFYTIKKGKRYWTGYNWVTQVDINKAMFFQTKEEARCVGGDKDLGKIAEVYITVDKPLPMKKFTAGYKSKTTKDGAIVGTGPKMGKGNKVTSHTTRVRPKKKPVKRRVL